jgi:hypothetical protein
VKIDLPQFNPNERERNWVRGHASTARFVQALWNAAGRKKHDPKFLSLLVRCGWVNRSKDRHATRGFRNHRIADFLGVQYQSIDQLAEDLSAAFPRLARPKFLLQMDTGVTHYREPYRLATLQFVERHSEHVGAAFRLVSSVNRKNDQRIRDAVEILLGLGPIHTLERQVSPLNGLTPVMACLDPRRKFPILGERTKRLLAAIGKRKDADGAVGLSHLIGHHGIKNSFDLDVYALTLKFKSSGMRRAQILPKGEFRDVGLKSEIDSIARIAAARRQIHKRHNALTNRLRDYLMWSYTFQEDQFDGLIPDWKPGRNLLIEAKTASDGPVGRTQVRQAIGQLFDYRHRFFGQEKRQVDLAVLLPVEPSSKIQSLLASLDIGVIWFKGGKLEGTIKL